MSVAVTTEPLSDDIAPGEPAPRVSMPPRVIAILPPRRAIAPAARSPVVVTRVSVASMTGVSAYSFDAYSPCALVPSVITRVRASATSPARISTPSEPTPLACRYESLNATVDVLGRNSTGA